MNKLKLILEYTSAHESDMDKLQKDIQKTKKELEKIHARYNTTIEKLKKLKLHMTIPEIIIAICGEIDDETVNKQEDCINQMLRRLKKDIKERGEFDG